MPRFHTIWLSDKQAQVDVPFTLEEEKARDQEEADYLITQSESERRESEFLECSAVLASGSATLEDVIRFLNLTNDN